MWGKWYEQSEQMKTYLMRTRDCVNPTEVTPEGLECETGDDMEIIWRSDKLKYVSKPVTVL